MQHSLINHACCVVCLVLVFSIRIYLVKCNVIRLVSQVMIYVNFYHLKKQRALFRNILAFPLRMASLLTETKRQETKCFTNFVTNGTSVKKF